MNQRLSPNTLARFLRVTPGEALTIATAAAGGLTFVAIGIPGGAISGAVIFVAILSLFGLAHGLGGLMRVTGLCIVGVAVGSVVGPDTFSNMAAYPLSVLSMALCVLVMTLAATAVWVWIMKWPFQSALLSSVPGSMSYIISVSIASGLDAPRIAVVQMSRVIFLVTILPLIIAWETGMSVQAPAGIAFDPLHIILVITIIALPLGWLMDRWGLAGGFLLAGMIVSGVAHFTGAAPGRMPPWVMNTGQIIVGAWVGSRFADFDWKLFWKIVTGTALAVGVTMVISVAFAATASWALDVPFGAALIGYAPGGLEAMVVLALALGVDPIFVTAHHFARYFLINLTLPFIFARTTRMMKQAQEAARPDGPAETGDR